MVLWHYNSFHHYVIGHSWRPMHSGASHELSRCQCFVVTQERLQYVLAYRCLSECRNLPMFADVCRCLRWRSLLAGTCQFIPMCVASKGLTVPFAALRCLLVSACAGQCRYPDHLPVYKWNFGRGGAPFLRKIYSFHEQPEFFSSIINLPSWN